MVQFSVDPPMITDAIIKRKRSLKYARARTFRNPFDEDLSDSGNETILEENVSNVPEREKFKIVVGVERQLEVCCNSYNYVNHKLCITFFFFFFFFFFAPLLV